MITVEDANSYVQKYGLLVDYYECDTSLISSDGSDEYSEVLYDFIKVSHGISGNNHTYIFEIVNTAYTGSVYILDYNGDYIESADVTLDGDTVTFTSTSPNITLGIALSNCHTWYEQYINYKLITPNVSYGLDNHPSSYTILNLEDDSTTDVPVEEWGEPSDWLTNITDIDNLFVVRFTEKQSYTTYLLEDLATINLTAGEYYELELSCEDDVTLEVSYLDKVETIDAPTEPLVIDLTGIYNIEQVDLKIKVFGNSKYVEDTLDYIIPVQAVQVSTEIELNNALIRGVSVIELTGSITIRYGLGVTTNTLIRAGGDNAGFTFNSDEGLTVDGDTTLRLEGLILRNGNPAIKQSKDSKVILEGCTFNNNTNTSNNNLGSCICCDIDIDSLDIVEDFTTIINNCIFTDNHNCILHGGNLTVTNSKYHNTDTSYVNINNPAFLFQVDGTASVRDSVFDITYDNDAFSSQGILYGQALFMIGSTATINDMTSDKIVEDDKVNWCNAPYNNASHLFAKYYYPAITSMVYSSPRLGFEDKNLAYCVSGTDWVFKANTQITKASDETENRNTKINW